MKAFECVDQNTLWKILKEMEMSDHLICLLRNLNAGQEGKVKTLVAQTVKNLPVIWETWVQSLGWENPLEEHIATHSSILAWRISMDRGACWAIVHGVAKSRTQLSI